MRLLFTTLAIATGLAGAVTVAAPAEAQPYGHDRGDHGDRHGPRWGHGGDGPRHHAYWRERHWNGHRDWRGHRGYHRYYGHHR